MVFQAASRAHRVPVRRPSRLNPRASAPNGATSTNMQPLPWLAAGVVLVCCAGLITSLCGDWSDGDVAALAVVAEDDVTGTGTGGGAAFVGAGAAGAGGAGAADAGGAGTDEMCELCETCETCPPVPDTWDEWLTCEPTSAGAYCLTANNGNATAFGSLALPD